MHEKSLVNNSIFNILHRMLNVAFPLATATYLGHVLLASGTGRVSYAQNIVLYFSTLATLGIPNYGIREIAKYRDDKQKLNITFTELFTINSISTTICTILYYIMVFTIPFFKNDLLLYTLAGIDIPIRYISIEWLYQGIEEYRYIATRNAIIKLVCLVVIFVFVKSPSDAPVYALIHCCAIGGNNLLNVINLKRKGIDLCFKKVNLKKHIKPVLILFASVVAIELYTMLDTTMLGAMCKDINVGYYTYAMRLVKVLMSAITAIAAVILPRLSFYYEKGYIDKCTDIASNVLNILLLLCIPCSVGIYLVAPQIMPLFFGHTFIPAVPTLQIASILICIIAMSNLFGTQILLTFGQEKKLLICTLAGAVTNIILNSFLIPKYLQNGAAIASVISEILVTGLSIYFAINNLKVKVNYRNVVCIFISTIFMIISVKFMQRVFISDWGKLIGSVSIGMFIYVIVNILSANPLLQELKTLLLKRNNR